MLLAALANLLTTNNKGDMPVILTGLLCVLQSVSIYSCRAAVCKRTLTKLYTYVTVV